MTKLTQPLFVVCCAVLIPLSYADQGSFTNSGGSGGAGSGVSVTSNVDTPAGTLSLNCPGTSTGHCAGGSFSYASADGTTTVNASFTSGTFSESCAGGGKGGHVSCGYSFTGYFSGTLTVNGQSQAITGVSSQEFGTGGAAAKGTSAYASAYAPFYYSDSGEILRSDDLQGTNQISFAGPGGDGGQFYGAYGIALDSAGRIYVADTYNCRIVRIDDMSGTNWTTYGGTCGSGQGQFYDPSGIVVDSAGKIYVMDTGNSRLVRMDDMTGANWIVFGAIGNGTGQFAGGLTSVTVDAGGRIYVADTGNRRVVRMDDMTGTNWTELTQSAPVSGFSQTFASPIAVAVDAAGRIYVADDEYYAPAVVRVDDMTGANWTSLYVAPSGSGGLNSIAVDASGTVFGGGGGAKLVVNMAAVLNSSGTIGPVGSYYVFGITPVPLPSPRPSAISFSPATLNFSQNVGTSGSLPLNISNFGGRPLNLSNISANSAFTETNNCPSQLMAGQNCTVTVTFTASATGPMNGQLSVSDDSGNLGAAQTVVLTGVGTAPAASISPATLTFSSQVLDTTSTAKTVTLQNTGTGPMQVAGVTATAPFSQTNNCTGSIAPGSSCAVQVSFTPSVLGSASGTLTVTDDAGTQTVNLAGSGSAPVSFSSSSLNFGSVAVGFTSAAKTVTLTNRAKVSLNVATVAASAGFTVASNTCVTSVAAGASCTVGVTFSPAATGSVTGTLTFTDDAVTSPQTVSLTGSGSAPVTLSPTSLSFNSVVAGGTSTARTVTLTNRETATLNFTSIAVSDGFAIATNTCGTSIAGGASCMVGITFSPTAIGSVSGTLTFTDDAGNSPQTASLTGNGSAPVTLSSSSLTFNSVVIGSTGSARTVTLTNHQTIALNFSSIAVSDGFAIASNTCGASIAGGASCTVAVTFSPTATGAITGFLTFTDDAGNSPQTVSLGGSGSAPVEFSSSILNLGTVTVGATSAARTITVTNRESGPLTFASVVASAGFAVDSNTCTGSLAAGAKCTVGVTFSPTTTGPATGTLTFTDDSATSPQTVNLTGNGQ